MSENVIGNLCFTLGLRGRYEQEITDFAKARGEEGCISILRNIQKIRKHQKDDGLRVDGAVGLWKRYSEQYVKSLKGKKRQEKQTAEWKQAREAHEAAKAKGYKPTQENIKKQLDELYEKSEISITEYEWGIRGLQCVHVLVDQAANLPDEKIPEMEVAEILT